MKKNIFLICLCGLFFTCRKKDEIDWTQYKASCYISGSTWQASKVVFSLEPNNTLHFGLLKFNEANELRQSLSLDDLNISKDTVFLKHRNSLAPSANFATTISHGDVLGEFYELLEDENFKSWVLLNKVSEDEISGQFQVAFKVDFRTSPLKNPLPDSIYLTKGVFFAHRKPE